MNTFNEYFSKLQDISNLPLPAGRDEFIKFLDTYDGSTLLEVVNSLAASFGLYPYIDKSSIESPNLAIEVQYHSANPSQTDDIILHSEQLKIFQKLLEGENVILSAPTSFGKSSLLDSLLQQKKYNNVVIILPTLALIDEFRRKYNNLFSPGYKIITHPDTKYSSKNIFILTQERFIALKDYPKIDFFFIDEYYKMSPTGKQDNERRISLNIAWEILRKTEANYYMAGPYIDDMAASLPQEIQNNFVRSNFSPVYTNIILKNNVNKIEDIYSLIKESSIENKTIIYTKSPSSANLLSQKLSSLDTNPRRSFTDNLADWISNNYSPLLPVVASLKSGILLHTGPMPRSIQRIMMRLFNSDDPYASCNVLICTSTIIEGVNTSAKNVILYDKKISTKNLDMFTYKNICGRAGRLKKHYVGNVYIYEKPPKDKLYTVDIPISSQSDSAVVEELLFLDHPDLSDSSKEKIESIDYKSLDPNFREIIKKNPTIPAQYQIDTAIHIYESNLDDSKNGPRSKDFKKIFTYALKHLGGFSKNSINRYFGMLYNVYSNPYSLDQQIKKQAKFENGNFDKAIISMTSFHRNQLQYQFPKYFMALETIFNYISRQIYKTHLKENDTEIPIVDYSKYIIQMESLYMPPLLIRLEELGLPIPLGLKIQNSMNLTDIDTAIASLKSLWKSDNLQKSLSDIELWILEDVISGL
jgi:helicase-like protein